MLRPDTLRAATGDGGWRGRGPSPTDMGWGQLHLSPTPWTGGSAWGESRRMPSPQIPGSSQEVSEENGVPPTSAESRVQGAPGGGLVKAHGQH